MLCHDSLFLSFLSIRILLDSCDFAGVQCKWGEATTSLFLACM